MSTVRETFETVRDFIIQGRTASAAVALAVGGIEVLTFDADQSSFEFHEDDGTAVVIILPGGWPIPVRRAVLSCFARSASIASDVFQGFYTKGETR